MITKSDKARFQAKMSKLEFDVDDNTSDNIFESAAEVADNLGIDFDEIRPMIRHSIHITLEDEDE